MQHLQQQKGIEACQGVDPISSVMREPGDSRDGITGLRLSKPEKAMTTALSKSILSYISPHGTNIELRSRPFHDWLQVRRSVGVWPYSRVLLSKVQPRVQIGDERGADPRWCINFGSQDYLGLAQHEAIRQTAIEAIREVGVHSAGSPALGGRTKRLFALEDSISKLLGKDACVIYSAGWAAGFGVISGLVRKHDIIVMDCLSHNCLQEGARHATSNVLKFAHNSPCDLERALKDARGRDSKCGLFVVIESLYSMDSDSPNLAEFVEITKRYSGILIIDVAHDFGCMGRKGLGLLESVEHSKQPDIVMGSFSKTFAANGGFVAASEPVIDYLRVHSAPAVFSNAISPMQTAVVSKCIEIIFSPEGETLRSKLFDAIFRLRRQMESHALELAGTPSPIVPVFVGDEYVARLTARNIREKGLVANLVEFPAVPRGKARFRLQVMPSHSETAITEAARILAESKAEAQITLSCECG
jgi:7-keto-8-aminopelargonate synthetase-like enzyme